MPETQLGRTAVEGYARYLGIPPQDFIASLSNRQSAADVADAVMSIAAQGAQAKDTLLMISAAGLAPQAQS